MKKILLILFLIPSICLASEFKIPFSCWPQELKREFEQTGRKLDLSPNERTDDSWGYVFNKGGEYSLFVYGDIKPEDFQVIQDIVLKVHKEKGK